MTLKGKISLAALAAGLFVGAFWAYFAGWHEQEPVSHPVTSAQLHSEEIEPLPPPSAGPVGRMDPFLSLLPEPAPSEPQVEAPSGFPSEAPSLPQASRQPPASVESPASPGSSFPWKLVGIGEGAKKMALLKKGKQVLVLEEGEAVDGWKLAQIRSGAVVFTQGKEQVELALEEVLTNEADN